MRAIHILALFITVCFTGCVGSPNLVHVTKGGIKAYGSIFGVFKKHEQIELIEINPRELSDAQMHELWVGLSLTNQTTFSEITEDAIKTIGVPSTKYYSASNPDDYFVCGYDFNFKAGQLVGFSADLHGNPPKDTAAFVKLGSRKNGNSLSLPCSVDDFEKVFGKADDVTRFHSW